MIIKLKLKQIFLIALILICFGINFKINENDEIKWFYDFFDRLRKKPINSVMFYSVWVQGDNDFSKLRPIGGSDNFYLKWKNAFSSFLEAQKKYQLKTDPEFKAHLIIDRRTFFLHQDDLINFKKKYQDIFNYYFIEDLYQDEQDKIIRDQCLNGIGSICSDMVRSTKEAEDDLMIYMDVDLFTDSFQHRKELISSKAYGLEVDYRGIYQKVLIENDKISWNCDILITYLNPIESNIARKNLRKRMDEYYYRYSDINQRKERAKIEKIEDYFQNLKERVNLIFEYTDHYIDQNKIIMDVIGPGFWRDMFLQGIAKPYYDYKKISKTHLSWIDDNKNNSFRSIYTIKQLKPFYSDEDIKEYIEYRLMDYDVSFFKKGNINWIDLLDVELKKKELCLINTQIK